MNRYICVCIHYTNQLATCVTGCSARKFKKQIFLSVDLPPTFISMEYGPQLALEVEKRLVETLKEIVAR